MIKLITLESWGGEFAVATTIDEYKNLLRDFAKLTEKEIEETMEGIEESRIVSAVPDNRRMKKKHVALLYPKNMSGHEDLVSPSLSLAILEYTRVFQNPPINVDMVGRLQKQLFHRMEEIVFPQKDAASSEGDEDTSAPSQGSERSNGADEEQKAGKEQQVNDGKEKQESGEPEAHGTEQ